MTHLVVDASVAVKWYLPREHELLTDEAFDLLKAHGAQAVRFIVPDVFWAEFGNVMWKAVRQRRLSERDARTAIEDITAWEIQVLPAQEMLAAALSLAVEYKRSFYDSLYAMAALRSRSELITADERLVNALGARFPVRWLGAYR